MKRSEADIRAEIKYHKELLQQLRNGELSKSYSTQQKESEIQDKLEELQKELSEYY